MLAHGFERHLIVAEKIENITGAPCNCILLLSSQMDWQ